MWSGRRLDLTRGGGEVSYFVLLGGLVLGGGEYEGGREGGRGMGYPLLAPWCG